MEHISKVSRRSFIKKAATGVAVGVTFLPNKASWAGANDRIRVAVVGIRGMGQNHISSYSKLPNVDVAALCDVDENLFEERIKKHFTDKGKDRPKLYTDIRHLIEDKSIDAVSIVTPNHWHALAAIWSIQAGKHVSVEKPCCHNFFEGQQLVKAAKKYNVIVQDISYRLGRSLDFDPVKQQFISDDEANSMLTRQYRKPFVVPEKV